ncbi:hypothetical protein BS17DRAFT_794279 [Gyrodon lividus]|nr:hypothetical protein BS17DRAFT_794279 [Gyrodon lividus]
MCPNICLAYTSPYGLLESSSNGCTKVPACKFTTITLATQLQAWFHHPQSAKRVRYLHECMQQIFQHLRENGEIPVIDDIAMGWDFLGAVLDGDIKQDDIVVMLLLDGAQLYQSKELDFWIYIWVILNMSPDKRYKKINVDPKPQNMDSFLFPGLHHVSALQKGLQIWNASRNIVLW